ncbi:unnamed protein product [Effrenium voratum]|uniref:Uncharacterized protein n=1 Tax=Effrenium voratum TaxID=2562239 RepID=A0AA36J7P0_9DINO|nr:unnamed protein product [Effrenium voratum]|mmetsp:Transcript_112999/g.269381  ORF Transcript_112999/g.269381 Transcript_112999/m.269381 type:complete len:207 (-) Transcript_112999:163-783(-)
MAAGFWQEMFNAITMLVPSVYLAFHNQTEGVPSRIRLMTWATYAHCLFSCAYHCQCALYSGRKDFNHFMSPLRTMDLSMIHVCLLAYTHAVSDDNAIFELLAMLLNLACVFWLIFRHLRGVPGSQADSLPAAGGILLYLSAMLARGDLANFTWVSLFYAVGGVCWKKSSALGHWGHGLFHLCLTPCAHFVLKSSALALGDACPLDL